MGSATIRLSLISAEGQLKYYKHVLIFTKALWCGPKYTQEKS